MLSERSFQVKISDDNCKIEFNYEGKESFSVPFNCLDELIRDLEYVKREANCQVDMHWESQRDTPIYREKQFCKKLGITKESYVWKD